MKLPSVVTALLATSTASAFAPLQGAAVRSIPSGQPVDLGDYLAEGSPDGLSLCVLGTYAADFNALEYGQRLRYYLPRLRALGVDRVGFVLNAEEEAAKRLCDLIDLDTAGGAGGGGGVELLADPLGGAGRKFGVGRGWRPDEEELFGVFTKRVSPYLKLFGMLFGLGAYATLPAVIGGYIGNPLTAQPWIEDAMAVGIRQRRWPDNALEIDATTGEVTANKFAELPLVGGWKRRPLELATLRLQNMVDISIKNWHELAPREDALGEGVLTQLGGCVVVDRKTGEAVYEWKDPGICAVCNFEDVIAALEKRGEEE